MKDKFILIGGSLTSARSLQKVIRVTSKVKVKVCTGEKTYLISLEMPWYRPNIVMEYSEEWMAGGCFKQLEEYFRGEDER